MNLGIEDGAANQRPEDFGQQEIRHGLELISGGRMSGNIDTEAAQLLNQSPDFGTIGRNLLRDFRAAYHDGCMLHQEAHDAAETNVGGLLMGCGSYRARNAGLADYCCLRNNENYAGVGGKAQTGEALHLRLKASGDFL